MSVVSDVKQQQTDAYNQTPNTLQGNFFVFKRLYLDLFTWIYRFLYAFTAAYKIFFKIHLLQCLAVQEEIEFVLSSQMKNKGR